MLKHYLTTGFRNFLKHKTSSLINALGLSLAVGCSLFVFIFIEFFMTLDEYHANGEEIFVIHRDVLVDNGTRLYSGIPEPMAPLLKERFATVEAFARLKGVSGYVRSRDKVFNENIRFTDPAFLEMFSFPLKWGLASSLMEPNAIILSEKMAEKYFGEENPVGKQLAIKFVSNDQEVIESFVIRGVAREFVKGSSFAFNFLVNYETLEKVGQANLSDWSTSNDVSFIQLAEKDHISSIRADLEEYVKLHNTANKEMQVAGFKFTPFLDASREGQKVVGNIFSSAGVEGFIVLSILATIIMVLACINYMNIAIASAAYRLKEIGIRKVMGGARKHLIYQFLAENLVICGIAMVLGLIWTQVFFLPGFQSLIPNPLALELTDPRLWVYLGALLVLTVLGGAGYPALYISKFQPAAILKDKVQFGGKSIFRRVLLGFQYFFSFIAVIAAIVLIQNDQYQRELAWGYDQQDMVVVNIKGGTSYEKLSQELSGSTEILEVTGSYDQIGRSNEEVTFKMGEELFSTDRILVGWSYIETLGLKLIEGRSFDQRLTSDQESAIIINQSFVQQVGWQEPIGQSVEIAGSNYVVVGVVADFHYQSFGREINSLMLQMTPVSEYRYLTARTRPGDMISAGATIEATWQQLFPDDPYDYFYQDTVFDYSFAELDMVTGVITTAGSIAIFLALIGLFGLSALRIKSKMKEISIRKILGGSWMHLGMVLNKEFLLLLGVASLIATPIAYQAVIALLGTITKYPMPLGVFPFMTALFLLFTLSMVAVGGHVLKAVRANPSETLRNE